MDLYRDPQSKVILVSGLKWLALDPFESTHNQITRFIADGNKWAVKFKNENDINYGLGSDFNADADPGCLLISLAALAAGDQNFQGSSVLLLLENTVNPDQGGIAIGMLAGNIILDRQFEVLSADTIIEDFSKLCGKSSRAYQVWGDVKCSHTYDHAYSLNELVNPKKKGFKSAKITPLKTERTVLFVIAAAVIVLLFVFASMGWDMYQAKQKMALDAIRALQNSPLTQYENASKAFPTKNFYLASTVSKEIVSQINQLPVSFHGWQMEDVKCDLPNCRVKWVSKGGTYNDFRDNAPEQWTNIGIVGATNSDGLGDLKTIASDYPLKLTGQNIKPKAEWPTLEKFLWSVGDQWQKYSSVNWKASLKKEEIQEIPAGLSPSSVASSPYLIWGMPWATVSQPWWLFEAINQSMGDTATFTKVAIHYDNTQSLILFSAEGIVYVQK